MGIGLRTKSMATGFYILKINRLNMKVNIILIISGRWEFNHFQGQGILYNEHPKDGEVDYKDLSMEAVDRKWNKFEGFF